MILRVNIFTLLGLLLVVANVVSSSVSVGGISAAKYSGAGSATKSSTAQSSHHSKSVLKHLLPTLLVYWGLRCIWMYLETTKPVLPQDMPTLLYCTWICLHHRGGLCCTWTAGACAVPGQVYTSKAWAAPGSFYIPQRLVLLLNVSTPNGPELHLTLSGHQ